MLWKKTYWKLLIRRSSFCHIPIIETDLYTIPDANIDILKADNNDIRECCSCIMTNPPYGNNNKTKFLEKCYEIGLPFMLLLPVQSLNAPARISMFQNFGITIMYLVNIWPRIRVFSLSKIYFWSRWWHYNDYDGVFKINTRLIWLLLLWWNVHEMFCLHGFYDD